MSAHMRKPPTKKQQKRKALPSAAIIYVMDDNTIYAIPRKVAQQYKINAKPSGLPPSDTLEENNISAETLFSEMDEKYTEAGALLQGLRAREGLTQVEFAKRLGITQTNLSKMENGKRPIGKNMAQRIAKEFEVDYQYFL